MFQRPPSVSRNCISAPGRSGNSKRHTRSCADVRRAPAHHVPHVQLRHFVAGQIRRLVALRPQRAASVAIVPCRGRDADEDVRLVPSAEPIVELGDDARAERRAEAAKGAGPLRNRHASSASRPSPSSARSATKRSRSKLRLARDHVLLVALPTRKGRRTGNGNGKIDAEPGEATDRAEVEVENLRTMRRRSTTAPPVPTVDGSELRSRLVRSTDARRRGISTPTPTPDARANEAPLSSAADPRRTCHADAGRSHQEAATPARASRIDRPSQRAHRT